MRESKLRRHFFWHRDPQLRDNGDLSTREAPGRIFTFQRTRWIPQEPLGRTPPIDRLSIVEELQATGTAVVLTFGQSLTGNSGDAEGALPWSDIGLELAA
jgi:hypothetical protein